MVATGPRTGGNLATPTSRFGLLLARLCEFDFDAVIVACGECFTIAAGVDGASVSVLARHGCKHEWHVNDAG